VPTPEYILQLRQGFGQGRLLLPGVSGVVVREAPGTGRRELLLVRRSDTGRWSLPAGIVEPFEQPATTLIREVAEETGVVVAVERLALLTTDPDLVYPNGDRCQFISMCFRCRYVSGEAVVGDEESTAVGWFGVGELPELNALQQRRIALALAERADCVFDL
jgi:8-oxo-dGTP diphosphatase